MKSTELRIGDLVELEGDVIEIIGVKKNAIHYYSNKKYLYETELKYIKPIKLTEEWLLKFGFEIYEFDHKENQYRLKDRLIVIRDGFFYDYGTSVKFEHVHQLQNFYFALTNKELELQ